MRKRYTKRKHLKRKIRRQKTLKRYKKGGWGGFKLNKHSKAQNIMMYGGWGGPIDQNYGSM